MITIWHNPRCSKSRDALKLLEQSGQEIKQRRYLEDAPTKDDITQTLKALGDVHPAELMRTGEKLFKELGLRRDMDQDTLIAAMAAHPILIERPVVFSGTRAVIGRPSEAVLDLL